METPLRKTFYLFTLLAFALPSSLFGQNGTLIDYVGSTRDNSAVLDVRSSNQGILVPRLTSGQRTGITSPANGLLVYDITLSEFYYYDSSLPGWSSLSGAVPVTAVTASNGLTSSGGTTPDITLGGTLSGNTTITQNGNNLTFDLNGSGDFEVDGNSGSALFIKEDGTIGINNDAPDASAILDIVSKAKGMLIPRMTFAERNAIPSPANSLIIFNTTSGCLEIFADGAWQSFYCSCPVLDPLQPILGPDPVCSGTTVNYSVPGVTGTATYEWTITGVLSGNITGQGGTAISFSAPALNTYDVTVVASNACLTSSSTQTVLGVNAYTSVPALPVWASTPSAICEGESYNYSVVNELGPNGTGAIDYTWTVTVSGSASATLTANSQVATAGNPAVFTGSASAITVNLGSTGAGNVNVSVTANNTCGSSSALTENLAVNLLSDNPTSATASIATICNGQNTNLTLNGGGGGTNEVVTWYTGGCGGSLVGTGNGLSVSPTATTTYFGRYETPAPCSDETTCQAVTITVNQPSVAPTSISGASAGCNGDPVLLTAIGGTLGTGANYQWGTGSVVGSNIITGQTGATVTVAPITTTTYWVRIVNTTSPCTAATAGVTTTLSIVQPSVAPTNITGTTPLCSNDNSTLTAVGGTLGTGANYQWGTGAVIGSNIIAGQTAATLSISPTSTTTYWVRIVNTANPCVATTAGVTLTITVNQPSVAPTSIGTGGIVCLGTPQTLTAVGGTLGTAANYQWGIGSVVGSNIIVGETGVTLSVSPTVTTSYWVRIVNTNSPCTATTVGVTTSLSINQPSVAPTAITGTTPLCVGDNTTLTAVDGTLGTGANYQWGTGAVVGSNVLAGQTASTLSVSPISTTIYWVRIVNTSSPCTANTAGVTLMITVNQPSVAPTSITGANAYCTGNPQITLTADGGTLGTSANYQWGTGSVVGTNPIVGQTGITLTVSPTTNTTYWVRIENGTAPCGATTGGVTQAVIVSTPSSAPTSINATVTTLCNGDPVTLTAVGGTLGSGANYQWGTGSTVGSNVIGGANGVTYTPSPNPTINTTYWVRIVNTNSPCTANTGAVLQTITVNQPSVAPTTISGTSTICNGDLTTLTANGTLGTNATYQWGTGTTLGSSVIGGAIASTYDATPNTNTTYWVRIINTASPCAATTGGTTLPVQVDYYTAANAGSDQTLCGTSASLSANAPATGVGSWTVASGSGNFSSSTDPAATVNGLNTGINTLTWTLTNGVCADDSDQMNVSATVVPADPSFGNGTWNTLGYNGGNINLTGTYYGYYTDDDLSYNTLGRWGSGGSPTDADNSSGTVWQGCAVPIDNHVVVSKRTGFTCGYYQLDVPNHDDDIRVYIDGTLVWSHEPGCCDAHTNIWTGYLESSTQIEVRHFEGGGGSHQSLTITSLGGTSTAPTSITGTASVCAGESTTLTQVGGALAPGATYQWYSGSCGGTPVSSGNSITVTVNSTTTYYVQAEGTCGNTGCASLTVNVLAAPSTPTSVTATPSSINSGDLSALSATSAGNTIDWYTTSTGGVPIGSSSSGSNFPVTPTTTTTYYAEANASSAASQTFNYTGSAQTLTVPAGVFSVSITANGAQGGLCNQGSYPAASGGLGGRAAGNLAVTPGQVLNIYVGGQGSHSGAGGYNGGGSAAGSNYGSSGGGASGVRLGGTGLANRVIVAGGGGGGSCGSWSSPGGSGGGTSGSAGVCTGCTWTGGAGGTQSSGGAGGCCYGTSPAGSSGNGGGAPAFHNAGGGGGYYGGGAGAAGSSAGGGSSYTDGVTGGSTSTGVNSGNGSVTISYNVAGCTSGSRTPVTVNVTACTPPSGSQTFSYTGGMQTWTAPVSGCIGPVTIEVWGAQGGSGRVSAGGLGARMRGAFTVSSGQVLNILVGGQGQNASLNGGGGGGTFVANSSNAPLIVAGGGGGGGYNASNGNVGGTTATTGRPGYRQNGNINAGAGGAGPNGGGTDPGYARSGAGGGGLSGNGASHEAGYAQGGNSFTNGGAGGAKGCNSSGAGNGGYGGGGGADWCYWTGGGGGGGYGGGGGGAYYGNGGGGGSFNGGASQSNSSAVKSGNGQVTISW
jgi:hypothetical protein